MNVDSHIPEDHSKVLLSTVRENCRIVEELALEAISSRHVPLLNSISCLSQEDCKFILDKYHLHCDNVYEHIVVLIALTDFISCVCTNSETFPLASRKNERKGIQLIIQTLTVAWYKQLNNLNSDAMTENQLMNIIKITKRCLERIPQNNYKLHLQAILEMQVKALDTLLKPLDVLSQDSTSTFMDEVLKPVSQAKKTKKGNKEKLKIPRNIKKCVKTPGNTVNNEYPVPSEDVKKEVMCSKDNTSASRIKVPKSIFKVRKMKENKEMLKKSFSITKFVLQPSENVAQESEQFKETVPHKRKFSDVEKLQTSKLDKGQDVEEAIELREEFQSPSPKKHCVHDDFINGKVNAFKMLMKPSKNTKFSTLKKRKQQ